MTREHMFRIACGKVLLRLQGTWRLTELGRLVRFDGDPEPPFTLRLLSHRDAVEIAGIYPLSRIEGIHLFRPEYDEPLYRLPLHADQVALTVTNEFLPRFRKAYAECLRRRDAWHARRQATRTAWRVLPGGLAR